MRAHLAGVAVALVTVTACGGGMSDAEKAEAQASASASASAAAADARRIEANKQAIKEREERQAVAAAEASARAALPPEPGDFTLKIITLEKQCFGSAGCSVTVRIDPEYMGTADLSDLEVTYEILGDEDGPMINTFTVDGAGNASFDSEESVSTASSSTVITAKVTSVRKSN